MFRLVSFSLSALALGAFLPAQQSHDGVLGGRTASVAAAPSGDGTVRGQLPPGQVTVQAPAPTPTGSTGLLSGGNNASPLEYSCVSNNAAAGTLSTSTWVASSEFQHRVVAPRALNVVGFEFYGRTTTAAASLVARLRTVSGSTPADPPARSGSMSVTTTAGWTRATFSPIAIGSGQTFFIGYVTPATGNAYANILTSGTNGAYYWGGPPTWSGPFTLYPVAWRVICDVDGQYVTYGYGCAGSGSGTGGDYCESLNANATVIGSQSWANAQFVHRVVASTDMAVDGFSFFCRTPAAATVNTYLYLGNGAGSSPGTLLRSGNMQVGSTATWARTCFPPVNITAGTVFYIGYQTVAGIAIDVGSFGSYSTYYWNGPTWSGPHSTITRAAWRVHCDPCVALNPFATTTGTLSFSLAQFVHRVVAPSDMWVDGFAFRCLNSSAVSVPTYLYRSLAGGAPAASAARTSTMSVGTTMAWTETRFSRIFVAAGEVIYIGYRVPSSTFRVDNGATGVYSTYYWNGPPTWNGPFSSITRTSWRLRCAPCLIRNDNASGTTTSTANAGDFAIGPFSSAAAQTIDSFAIYMGAASNVATTGHVYLQSGTAPAAASVRSGQMQVLAGTGGWVKCCFPPLALSAGQNYYVGFSPAASGNIRPLLTSGTTVPYHYRAAPGAWGGPFTTLAFGVRVYCAERGAPSLGNNGVPEIGRTFQITLNGARTGTAAGLILGFSRSTWGPISLPWNLAPLGAPECHLLTSYDMLLTAIATGATGNGVVTMGIPNAPALVDANFYNQFFVIDVGANALNIVFSNGGAAKIGG